MRNRAGFFPPHFLPRTFVLLLSRRMNCQFFAHFRPGTRLSDFKLLPVRTRTFSISPSRSFLFVARGFTTTKICSNLWVFVRDTVTHISSGRYRRVRMPPDSVFRRFACCSGPPCLRFSLVVLLPPSSSVPFDIRTRLNCPSAPRENVIIRAPPINQHVNGNFCVKKIRNIVAGQFYGTHEKQKTENNTIAVVDIL